MIMFAYFQKTPGNNFALVELYIDINSRRQLISTSLLRKNRDYRQSFNMRCIKFQNLNVFRLVLQLSLPNPSKPGVKSRMKI